MSYCQPSETSPIKFQQDNAVAHPCTSSSGAASTWETQMLPTCDRPTAWTLNRLITANGKWCMKNEYHTPIQDVAHLQQRVVSTLAGFQLIAEAIDQWKKRLDACVLRAQRGKIKWIMYLTLLGVSRRRNSAALFSERKLEIRSAISTQYTEMWQWRCTPQSLQISSHTQYFRKHFSVNLCTSTE